jgi:hypothetical protein
VLAGRHSGRDRGSGRGLFDPLLVGPEAKIRAAAEAAKVSLDGIAIESVTPRPNAR